MAHFLEDKSQRENLSEIKPPFKSWLFDPVDMNFIFESISLSAYVLCSGLGLDLLILFIG